MNQKTKIKICVLHGAISNAGDFLIYERGKKLLETFLGDDFDFTYILRTKQIIDKFDGMIILGGPLISRKLHSQSKNILKYLKTNKDIPVFCIGLGISGEKFDSMNYFLDDESIHFWRYVYETSKLFSVRDKTTYNILNKYGIKMELTGCPALFNLDIVEKMCLQRKKSVKISKIAVTIPNLSLSIKFPFFSPSLLKNFIITVYFLCKIKRTFREKTIGLFFQHGYRGYNNLLSNVVVKLGKIIAIKTYDVSGKSLDSVPEISNYDVHIGTRLHSHIYFLSSGKPSILFNIDMRTKAFLNTIKTPTGEYTFWGIKNLVALLAEKIENATFSEFNSIPNEIEGYYKVMKSFIGKIDAFYKSKQNYENIKN